MTDTAKPVKEKSLRNRLFWGFVLCVAVIWISIVCWGMYTVLTGGQASAAKEGNIYARQVLAVVKTFKDHPDKLAIVAEQVAAIESEPDEDGDVENLLIQVWVDGKIVKEYPGFPSVAPVADSYVEVEVNGELWDAASVFDQASNVAVSVWTDETITAALHDGDWFFLFIPLFFSLPLLLIPAWVMTRYGLQPLGAVVDEISERVDSGALTPLSRTRYRELNPVIHAVNQLMGRLDEQLIRERGFVADVAHELKTPMAIMQSNVGIIETSESDRRKDLAVKDLGAGIERSNHLISQLLRLARMEQGTDSFHAKRRLDLAEFLRERVVQAEPLASFRDVTLEVQAPTACRLDIDADAIAAVIDNLLDNAIKYSPAGGHVEVALDCVNESNHFTLKFVDQGPGIPEAQRGKAFARFDRLAESTEQNDIAGAGLGLSIVVQALTRLGGEITLGSGPDGRGLAATVLFNRDELE